MNHPTLKESPPRCPVGFLRLAPSAGCAGVTIIDPDRYLPLDILPLGKNHHSLSALIFEAGMGPQDERLSLRLRNTERDGLFYEPIVLAGLEPEDEAIEIRALGSTPGGALRVLPSKGLWVDLTEILVPADSRPVTRILAPGERLSILERRNTSQPLVMQEVIPERVIDSEVEFTGNGPLPWYHRLRQCLPIILDDTSRDPRSPRLRRRPSGSLGQIIRRSI